MLVRIKKTSAKLENMIRKYIFIDKC